MININASDMQALFYEILVKQGLSLSRAQHCAAIFTANSIDGVYTHGVNRFPRFVEYIQKGYIDIDATPELKHGFGGIQQWDGKLGIGPLNAVHATDTAMQLARQYGIGCVALANTNHWMRGGTYGWQAAKAGFVFIGWTNTTALMPAWGATEAKLGNNPLVMALPYKEEGIVLDMAMSQYSFGALELAALKNEQLPVFGGYDAAGNLSTDPAAIHAAKRPLPIGYWKGAGLALLLDLLAAMLSGGLAVHEIASQKTEKALSQVFVAIDISKLNNYPFIAQTVEAIIADYNATYPGERVLRTRQHNLEQGIPVVEKVWDAILKLL